MITIVVSLRGRVITAQSFEQERIRIGRAADNEVRIDNAALSRHHAVIERDGRVYTLADLSERNGIYLNGERVRRRHLNHGDTIALGKFVLTVDLTRAAAGTFAPAARTSGAPGPARGTGGAAGDRTLAVAPATRSVARPGAAAAIGHLRFDPAGPLPRGFDPAGPPPRGLDPAVRAGGEPLLLEDDVCLVGSAAECHVRPRGLFVPGRLALLIRGHGGFSLLSLGRGRQVLLGGAPLEGRAWLRDGDDLSFCGLRARFHLGLPLLVGRQAAS